MGTAQTDPIGQFLELLAVVAPTAHEEREVDETQQQTNGAEGYPEETAENET